MVNIILIITPSLSHDNYTANNNQLKELTGDCGTGGFTHRYTDYLSWKQ